MHPQFSPKDNAYPEPVNETGASVELVDRIESFTPITTFVLPESATGSLAQLLTWWLERGSDFRPQEVVITPGGFESGVTCVDSAINTGATLLTFHNDFTTGSDTLVESVVTRAIIGLLARKDAWQVTHQGPGMSDQQVMDQLAATVNLMRANRDKRAEPRQLAQLDASGTVDFLVGALLAASARKTPVILGSTSELAAALIAHRISMKASNWWRSGATSPDRAVGQAVERIGIAPGLPLDLSDDQGVGAQISVELLKTFISDSPK